MAATAIASRVPAEEKTQTQKKGALETAASARTAALNFSLRVSFSFLFRKFSPLGRVGLEVSYATHGRDARAMSLHTYRDYTETYASKSHF